LIAEPAAVAVEESAKVEEVESKNHDVPTAGHETLEVDEGSKPLAAVPPDGLVTGNTDETKISDSQPGAKEEGKPSDQETTSAATSDSHHRAATPSGQVEDVTSLTNAAGVPLRRRTARRVAPRPPSSASPIRITNEKRTTRVGSSSRPTSMTVPLERNEDAKTVKASGEDTTGDREAESKMTPQAGPEQVITKIEDGTEQKEDKTSNQSPKEIKGNSESTDLIPKEISQSQEESVGTEPFATVPPPDDSTDKKPEVNGETGIHDVLKETLEVTTSKIDETAEPLKNNPGSEVATTNGIHVPSLSDDLQHTAASNPASEIHIKQPTKAPPSGPPLPSKPRPIPKPSVAPLHVSNPAQTIVEESWEQKTYQEIVRLRMEMFWARIGVEK
jgi:hypothetical protein